MCVTGSVSQKASVCERDRGRKRVTVSEEESIAGGMMKRDSYFTHTT
jgi:hypothetical protein